MPLLVELEKGGRIPSPVDTSRTKRTHIAEGRWHHRGILEGGADVRYVREMLGHEELSSTQIYTKVSIGKLKEVYEKSHPAGGGEDESKAS